MGYFRACLRRSWRGGQRCRWWTMSPSGEMLLKDLSIAEARRGWSVLGDMGASVQRMPRRVPMFGCIIPAPLWLSARGVEAGYHGRKAQDLQLSLKMIQC